MPARPRAADVEVVARLAHAGRVLAPGAALVQADARDWLAALPDNAVQAVVTDPPYGLVEYEERDHDKLRAGRGGVWRIPPSFDGAKRRPVPRFTVLRPDDVARLVGFFGDIARQLARVVVPGGHLFVASNPLVATWTFDAFAGAGLEYRGAIVRTVQTLRGGDRPKGAHEEFPDVTVMPRSCWEPWGLFRVPLEGTVAANLRRWSTGGLRRRSAKEPFKDLIGCAPTQGTTLNRTHPMVALLFAAVGSLADQLTLVVRGRVSSPLLDAAGHDRSVGARDAALLARQLVILEEAIDPIPHRWCDGINALGRLTLGRAVAARQDRANEAKGQHEA